MYSHTYNMYNVYCFILIPVIYVMKVKFKDWWPWPICQGHRGWQRKQICPCDISTPSLCIASISILVSDSYDNTESQAQGWRPVKEEVFCGYLFTCTICITSISTPAIHMMKLKVKWKNEWPCLVFQITKADNGKGGICILWTHMRRLSCFLWCWGPFPSHAGLFSCECDWYLAIESEWPRAVFGFTNQFWLTLYYMQWLYVGTISWSLCEPMMVWCWASVADAGPILTLSCLNFPLSSSSTTSRELLSQFSTCSGWRWLEEGGRGRKLLIIQFHQNVRSKNPRFLGNYMYVIIERWYRCFDSDSEQFLMLRKRV